MNRRGTIFDRSIIPGGWRFPRGVTRIQTGHGTSFWPDRNERVSWNNPGMRDLHWTDQNLPKHNPDRHDDPRG